MDGKADNNAVNAPSPGGANHGIHRTILAFVRREKRLLLLLSCLSMLLGWQKWGMNKERILSPGTDLARVIPRDDHADGGKSICSLEEVEGVWRIHYDTRPGVSWAFCGIGMILNGDRADKGMNLSDFDTMIVEFGAITGNNKSFQATFKAMEPALYHPGDEVSLKFHTMVFFPEGQQFSRNVLPLNYFNIPPWWVTRNHVAIQYQNPDRGDVRELEFLTSTDKVVYGSGTIDMRRVVFQGKWIRQSVLIKTMLGALLLSVFPLLGFRLYGAIRTERDLLARERQLQELASQDPLTGILNRRGLELALQEMNIKLYQKKEQTIGVLMLDLDHFKQVNDTFGHDAGDEVLQQISRVLRAEVREGNLLSRWGGEEFILVFANIPEDRLRYVAEKIRAHIESTVRWQDRVVTASIGFALGEAARFQALVKQADLALYQAKQKGRNRVEPIA